MLAHKNEHQNVCHLLIFIHWHVDVTTLGKVNQTEFQYVLIKLIYINKADIHVNYMHINLSEDCTPS